MVESYPALLEHYFPIVVVSAVEESGVHAIYSQGLATELTVSVAGRVWCASTVRPKGWEKFTFDFNRNGCEFQQFSMDFPTIYVQVNTIKSIDLC